VSRTNFDGLVVQVQRHAHHGSGFISRQAGPSSKRRRCLSFVSIRSVFTQASGDLDGNIKEAALRRRKRSVSSRHHDQADVDAVAVPTG